MNTRFKTEKEGKVESSIVFCIVRCSSWGTDELSFYLDIFHEGEFHIVNYLNFDSSILCLVLEFDLVLAGRVVLLRQSVPQHRSLKRKQRRDFVYRFIRGNSATFVWQFRSWAIFETSNALGCRRGKAGGQRAEMRLTSATFCSRVPL